MLFLRRSFHPPHTTAKQQSVVVSLCCNWIIHCPHFTRLTVQRSDCRSQTTAVQCPPHWAHPLTVATAAWQFNVQNPDSRSYSFPGQPRVVVHVVVCLLGVEIKEKQLLLLLVLNQWCMTRSAGFLFVIIGTRHACHSLLTVRTDRWMDSFLLSCPTLAGTWDMTVLSQPVESVSGDEMFTIGLQNVGDVFYWCFQLVGICCELILFRLD